MNTDDLNRWLEFYFGTTDVTPAKMVDSLSGFRFGEYRRSARNQAERANARRVLDYARSKGLPIETSEFESDGFLSRETADKVNKELSELFDSIKDSVSEAGEQEALAKGTVSRGLELQQMTSRPNLLFGGIKNDVVADGFVMLIGNGSRKFLSDFVSSKKGIRGTGVAVEDIGDRVDESDFPKFKQLIPPDDIRSGELRVVGVGFTGGTRQGSFVVYLTDNVGVVSVDADKFAWLRDKLPTAKVFGSLKSNASIKTDSKGETVFDKGGRVVWDRSTSDILDPASPLSFVVAGKTVGVMMPLFGTPEKRDRVREFIKDDPEVVTAAGGTVRQETRKAAKEKRAPVPSTSTPSRLQAIHEARSLLSQSSDESQEHSLVVDPDDPRVKRWKRDPGSMDVRGIDTPKKGKGKKRAPRKSRQDKGGSTSLRSIRE